MNFQKFTTFKTILIAFVFTITASQSFAQTTNGIFFQAVARDNFSNPAKDRKIYVQSSIIQTTPTGTKVLTEEHQANTDATGVFSISLGNGVRVGGTASGLATIDWSKGPFYLNLKVAITPIGGNSSWDYNKEWVDMGTTSFGAVPFALYSASSAKVDDKLNATDTTKMLAVYAKAIKVQSLETSLASKLTAADTLTMLAPYAKAAYTIDSSFFKTQLATKLSLSDSTKYVTPKMLAAKSFDSTSIYNQLALKASLNDFTSLTTSVASNSASVTSLTTSVASNSASVTSLTASVASNSASVTSLTTSVASYSASITANSTAINLKAPLTSPLFTGTVAIGTNNPSAAAALDITSTTQGLLLPRLTYAQKMSISSPDAGLVLWCSDCGTRGEMQVYDGNSFVNLIGGSASLALPAISSTTGAYSITTSSAISGGVVSSDGGSTVYSRGIVWGTSTGPTIALVTKTTDGTGVGTYTSTMTGLTSGVTYYVRAYATNNIGTKYGTEISFNSLQALATLATTTTAYPTSATTALSGGSISYNGGATVTASGVVWSTTTNPTIDLTTKTSVGATSGTFTSSITGLTSGVTYYLRSYATNSVGTSYGAEITFTAGLRVPTIATTSQVSIIDSTRATSGGNITLDGGTPITASGLVWSTTSNPTIDLTTKTTDGAITGTFTSTITGLTKGVTYYVRSYATNSVGTSYGPNITFTLNSYSYSFVIDYNGMYYIVSVYKFDGNAWTYVSASPTGNYTGSYVGQLNNKYYSLIYNPNAGVNSLYSFNGTTWSPVTTSGITPNFGMYLGLFGNKVYFYGYNNSLYSTYSFDGANWQTINTTGSGPSNIGNYLGNFNNVSYYTGFNGYYPYYVYSFNGTTWTQTSISTNMNSYYSYEFIGQIGNTSYLRLYNGSSSYNYYTFNGTSFTSWTPSGLPNIPSNSISFNYLGVLNNKLYTCITYYDYAIGASVYKFYSFDGTSFTNLPNITKPGSSFGGFPSYFIGGDLK